MTAHDCEVRPDYCQTPRHATPQHSSLTAFIARLGTSGSKRAIGMVTPHSFWGWLQRFLCCQASSCGAGASGLPAAIEATKDGASVILKGANFDVGGHAILSGGNVVLGGGTSRQVPSFATISFPHPTRLQTLPMGGASATGPWASPMSSVTENLAACRQLLTRTVTWLGSWCPMPERLHR